MKKILLLLFCLFFPFSAFGAEISLKTCQQEPQKTAKDCFYMESFSKENKKCISRIPHTKALQTVIDRKMTDIAQYPPKFFEQKNALSFAETQNIYSYNIFENVIVHPYPHPNEKLLQIYGNKKVHWRIWKALTKIYPKKYREELKIFRIFTDGIGGETARVGLLVMPIQKISAWGIAVDPADIDDLPYTLLHELAHVIVDSQEEHKREALFLNCQRHFTAENTTIRNSYFPLFAEKFWENPNNLPFDKENFIKNVDISLLEQKEKIPFFVTEYAGTNAIEDFAETFAHFVLLPKPLDDETSIVSQKLNFFWQFPDMIRLRDSLRFGVLMLAQK